MKKIRLIPLVMILSIFAASCTESAAPLSAAEYLDLGGKYLLELNYEQALVQFLRVIEVEPMNPRGYTGAAESYVGLGRPNDAVNILQRGLELTGDDAIRGMLEELTQDDDFLAPDNDIAGVYDFTAEEQELCRELISALTNEDYAQAAAIAGGGIYKHLAANAETGELIIQREVRDV